MTNYRLLIIINALFYASLGLTSPLLTLYLEWLGASYGRISLILTSSVAIVLLANHAWGRLSDRFGRRKPFFVAGLLLLVMAQLLLSGASDSSWAWLVRTLEALGIAAFQTLGLTLIGDALARQEAATHVGAGATTKSGRRMGLFRGVGSLAFAGAALGGGRLADAISLRAVFLASAGVNALAAGVALGLRERREPTTGQRVASPAAIPLAARKRARQLPVLFTAGVVLWMAGHTASASMWPNFMGTLGYSNTAISSLWAVAALVEMPTMVGAGVLSDVIGRPALLAAGGATWSLVMLGYLTVAQLFPALLGVQIVRGVSYGSYTATAMTFTAEQGDGSSRGRTSSEFFVASSGGQLVGMLMGGTLVQWLGFGPLFALCALLAAASAVCFLAMRTRAAKPVASAA